MEKRVGCKVRHIGTPIVAPPSSAPHVVPQAGQLHRFNEAPGKRL